MPTYVSALRLQLFDSIGQPLANGWVTFYESGTSRISDQVYGDSIGTKIDNPVQLNSAGTAVVYLDGVAYRVYITDEFGVLIADIDPWFGPGGAGSILGGDGTIAVVNNYNALRTLAKDFSAVLVLGRATAGDGAGGWFIRSASGADNDGTILTRATSSYHRNYNSYIDPRWFGVEYNNMADQSDAYHAAEAAGPVEINGTVYFTSDVEITGTRAVLSGGFNGSDGVKLTVSGTLLYGSTGMFGSGLSVKLMNGVTPDIHTSWFGGGILQAAKSSDYSYDLLFDKDETLVSDLLVLFNLRFVPKAILDIDHHTNINIKLLEYTGIDQWIRYADESYIGIVNLNGIPARPEWFGFKTGDSPFLNNVIPIKAAFTTGLVLLRGGEYYYCKESDGLALPHDLTISSDAEERAMIEIRNSQNITGSISLTRVDVVAGSPTTPIFFAATKDLNVTDASINGVMPVETGLSAYTSGEALPQSYLIADNAGFVRASTDLATWSSTQPTPYQIKGIVERGSARVIVAGLNQIYASGDGGITWKNIMADHSVSGLKYANGKYVIVCTDGYILWTVDPINSSWAASYSGSAGQLNDIEWDALNNLWIAVGNAAKIAYSPDLVTWHISGAIPTGITGNLLCITTNKHSQVIGGDLNGAYLKATDGMSWYQKVLPANAVTYTALSHDVNDNETTIVLAGGQFIFSSTDYGESFGFSHGASWAITCGARNSDASLYFFGSGTSLITTTDLKNGVITSSGYPNNIQWVGVLDPVYMLTSGSALAFSADGRNWSPVTLPAGVTSVKRIKSLNGSLWLLCDGGKLYITSDGKHFASIPTGTSQDLYDITYYQAGHRYVLVGSNGFCAWILESTLWSNSVVWTIVTSATSITFKRVVFVSTTLGWMLIGDGVSAILTEAPGPTYAVKEQVYNGMVVAGATFIKYGNNGSVLRSTDNIAFVPVVTGVTSNLLDGIYDGTAIILVGAAGVIIRSIDGGVTWTSMSGVSNQINRIKLCNTTLMIVTVNHTAYKSVDHGASWANAISALTPGSITEGDWNDVWYDPDGLVPPVYWICGTGAQVLKSTDLVTWTSHGIRTGGSGEPYLTNDLHCGSGQYVFGNNGVLCFLGGSEPDYYPQGVDGSLGSMNLRRLDPTTGVATDDAGYAYLLDNVWHDKMTAWRPADPSDLSGSGPYTLAYDPTTATIYATGGGTTWKTLAKNGWRHWVESSLTSTAGLADAIVDGITIRACGSNGLYMTSTNAIVWQSQRIENDPISYESVRWVLASNRAYGWMGAVAVTFSCPSGVLICTGSQALVGPSLDGPTISVASATVRNSVIDVALFNLSVDGAIISSSTIRNCGYIKSISDSVIKAQKGALEKVVRCEVTLAGRVSLLGSVYESSISKTNASDPTKTAAFAIAQSNSQIVDSEISINGPLVTAAHATSFVFNVYNSTDSRGWAYAITDNVLVSLANCGTVVANTSMQSVDGNNLDDLVEIGSLQTLSASTSGWYGAPGASWDGADSLILASDAILSGVKSMRTIRYASDTTALHLLMQLGGRIKLTVRYPSGFTPLPQALPTAKIVRPSFAGSEQFMFLYSGAGYRYSCEGEQVGVSTTCQETTAGAYATSWTNVWGGIQSPLNAAGGEDSYGDIHPAVNIFDWLVIYDAGSGCLLPAGTKISVTVYPNVPKTRKQYSLFYNEKASGIDPILGVEKVPLAWSDYRDGQLVVLRERETGSAIVNDVQYESIAIMGPVVGGANAGSYYIQQDNFHLPSGDTWPTNHATLFPALAGAFVPVKIIHSGLQYSAALAWPVYQHAAIPDPYHPATKALPRLESETVNSIDGWNYNFRTWMPL